MNSAHLVDPELRPLLELFPTTVLSRETLETPRARVLPIPPYCGPAVAVEVVETPGPEGGAHSAIT